MGRHDSRSGRDGCGARLRAGGRRGGAALLVACLAIPSAVTGAIAGAGPEHAVAAGEVDAAHGAGPIGPGGTIELTVLGRGGVPAEGVEAVVLNVTATNPTEATFLAVWPAGGERPLAATLVARRGRTTGNAAMSGLGVGGRVAIGNHAGTVDVVVDVVGWFAEGSGYRAVRPARLHDSRPAHPTVDGASSGGGLLQGPVDVPVPVAGRGGVPPGPIGAAVVNITVVEPSAGSFVTAWSGSTPRPLAATLTVGRHEDRAGLAVVPVGPDGAIALHHHTGTAHLVVDVVGWLEVSSGYVALTPARLHDSRPGEPTVDGAQAGAGALTGGAVASVDVAGRAGVPATGVAAVVLHVTLIVPTEATFLTVWPAGTSRPPTASLNALGRRTTGNLVVTGLGAEGRIDLAHHAGSADVAVDVAGWIPDAAGYGALAPARLLDTRGPSSPTVTEELPTYPWGPCDVITPGLPGFHLDPGDEPDELRRIGTSVRGRPIWAEYRGPRQPRRVVVVVGQVHGNECSPTLLAPLLRAHHPTSYGVWYVPTLNPDGHAASTRANARGRDLNTDGWTADEPETRARLELTRAVRPVLTVHVHSPNGFVGWFGVDGIGARVAAAVAARTGLPLSGAGTRPDRGRWFLWQGQREVHPGGDAVLLEVHAVADGEVPTARPRPPSRSVAHVTREFQALIAAIDVHLR